MTDDLKLFWKLYYEWYPNERMIQGFDNLLSSYLRLNHGKIIDIGCGQSTYILNLLDSNYELYAVDTEPLQIELLKRRIQDCGYNLDRVNFSEDKFPSDSQESHTYAGVVLSNILHFYTFEEAKDFAVSLKRCISSESVILIRVHPWHHPSNNDENPDRHAYFKHYFTKEDLYELFPASEFEHLYYSFTEARLKNYELDFFKEWIKQDFILNKNITEPDLIKTGQEIYMQHYEKPDVSMTLVIRKR